MSFYVKNPYSARNLRSFIVSIFKNPFIGLILTYFFLSAVVLHASESLEQQEVKIEVSNNQAVVVVNEGKVAQVDTSKKPIDGETINSIMDKAALEGDGVYVLGSDEDTENTESFGRISKIIDLFTDSEKHDEKSGKTKKRYSIRLLPHVESYELPLVVQNLTGKENTTSYGFKFQIKFRSKRR